ncbi:MAG: type I DNA topoisomerase [Caldilineae bacterium]|nr:MAG: type I DNA topoisomerase [Caldilineae bacterium]
MEAYCVKCKTKREMVDPTPVFTANGAPGTRGTCPVCGTNLFRMGATPAHEGLERPKPTKTAPKKRATDGRKQGARKGKLVVVESPAKARTVGRFLGRGYTVKASIGHVRDLYKSRLSVDVENDFAPQYTIPRDKRTRQVVKELKDAVAQAEEVYLATDPDREGEAIAWHVQEVTGLEPERTRRVVFHEITKSAVSEAFQKARQIDMNLVNAQQARRILDRLVGYQISPLLWRNVRRGLSAGRVQTVALRLIVEREREIEAFVPEEYWSIDALLAKREPERRSFKAGLYRINGEDFTIATGDEAQKLVEDLEQATWEVSKVKKGKRTRRPYPPFTTSTMQQEASRRLNFTARRTMRVAQTLYEGVKLGSEGSTGLITYMRTDSTNVSKEAQAAARRYIADNYGDEFMPAKPPVYRTRTRAAQEAHEAIRPTSVFRTPESVRPHLSAEQYRLYRLIWMRFVASQMAAAIYDTLTVEVLAGPADGPKPYLFRATGSTLRFPGFLKVYEEARSEDESSEDDLDVQIPPLTVGELLDLLELIPEQHFTQPPPRYSEATLVKALEQYGIGRPSTYATILSTIQERGYVERKEKRLLPTELGRVVNDLLVKHFDRYFDVNFTAHMEEDLDRIANGEADWIHVLREFYAPFAQTVQEASSNMTRQQLEPEKLGEPCPECGHELVIRQGRYGKFIGCSNYPECKYTRQIVQDTGVACPKDGGRILVKRSRKGRVFYGCENWPACDFVSWNEPLAVTCPQCQKSILTKAGKRARCADKECGYSMPLRDALKLLHNEPEPA